MKLFKTGLNKKCSFKVLYFVETMGEKRISMYIMTNSIIQCQINAFFLYKKKGLKERR